LYFETCSSRLMNFAVMLPFSLISTVVPHGKSLCHSGLHLFILNKNIGVSSALTCYRRPQLSCEPTRCTLFEPVRARIICVLWRETRSFFRHCWKSAVVSATSRYNITLCSLLRIHLISCGMIEFWDFALLPQDIFLEII
jgi:hypothetical protein